MSLPRYENEATLHYLTQRHSYIELYISLASSNIVLSSNIDQLTKLQPSHYQTQSRLIMSSSFSYPLLAIPAYYIFSILPHVYAQGLLTSNGYQPDNANPKSSTSPTAIKGKVPDAVFKKYQRAEGAQSNNIEQMPIFAVAILASIIAERTTAKGLGREVVNGDATGLATFVGAWFVVRSVYVVAYISIKDHSKSFIRSLLWVGGSGLAFWQIYKAAALLG
ncbi:MAPEG family-domain-containing protein [Phaeosphaeriaceae sp. PMI808]|nr:MAPEG family-domain-containing protein [Phaeosphaeriaceae sp. PMI808]